MTDDGRRKSLLRIATILIIFFGAIAGLGRIYLMFREGQDKPNSGNLFNMSDTQAYVAYVILMTAFFVPAYFAGALSSKVRKKTYNALKENIASGKSQIVSSHKNGWQMVLHAAYVEMKSAKTDLRLKIPYAEITKVKHPDYGGFGYRMLFELNRPLPQIVSDMKDPLRNDKKKSGSQPKLDIDNFKLGKSEIGVFKYYNDEKLLAVDPPVGIKPPYRSDYNAVMKFINEQSNKE